MNLHTLFGNKFSSVSFALSISYCQDHGHKVSTWLHLFIYLLFLKFIQGTCIESQSCLATGDINNEQDSHICCFCGTYSLEEGALIYINN